MPEKKIIIIAGPNGAGKSTFANEFLPQEAECFNFINADLIAQGLSPFHPDHAAIRAGRIMLKEMKSYIEKNESFAFETTLSGKLYASKIPNWQSLGYLVKLMYLSLPSANIAVARVAARVAQGGHDIPEPVIRRRFVKSNSNFKTLYKPLVNSWILYDSSHTNPLILDEGENECNPLKEK